ncbi:FAD-binding oxidoreductase [Acinetobacter pseudolwoffii]|uniref:FAD-binding oxidoreductase n=1 Tax=Acinetobacter pseudolwoffii TaxID=2053287 RepID=UPI003988A520
MNSQINVELNLPELIVELVAIVGEGRVKTDDDTLHHWGKDQTQLFKPNPIAVVFPSSTEQVQAVVKLANQYNFAITPSGGRTGLSGGAVAKNGEIVISLDKMNKIQEFLQADRIVKLQAGVVTEQLQNFAEEKGYYYPVDFASSGSSQIGGNISTNAGGIKVIKYGMTRNWILGLTVVTGRGDILRLNKGMIKNATGYALQHLFIGGEGTLGIVTEVEVRLDRQPQNLQVLVLGVPDFDSVMPILHEFRRKIDLTAFEFFNENAMSKVIDCGHVQRPFENKAPFYVLLEYEAPYEAIENTAMQLFESCLEQGLILDGVMSQSIDQLNNLWRLREDISESLSSYITNKNDISVLISYVPDFIKDIEKLLFEAYPGFETCWFGHIGDGNLHLNILKPENIDKDQFIEKCKIINPQIFSIVQKYEGSISAEHGVGLTKKPYLSYSRSSTEIEYMAALKKVFDPNLIMNPGKIIDI